MKLKGPQGQVVDVDANEAARLIQTVGGWTELADEGSDVPLTESLRTGAEAAAAVLQERGFSVDVGRRLLKIWLTFERTDAITRDRIRAVLDEVVPVIAQHGGEYDGWGSMAQGDAEG